MPPLNDALDRLKMEPGSKRRSTKPFLAIFAGIAAVTAVTAFFAWPRGSDSRRLAQSSPGSTPSASAKESSSQAGASPPPPSAPAPPAGEVVLTVSGHIINRDRISLSPRFLGIVKWIGVRKGDAVTNGQVLVELDDAEQRAKLAQAAGQLTNAMVEVEKARLDHSRMTALRRAAVESEQSADDARLHLDSREATLKEITGVYELAKTYLDWTVIRSPINGVVLQKLVNAGELVVPQSFGGGGPSTALVELADPSDLQVEIDIGEADLSKVHLRQPCRVSPEAFPDHLYDGYVDEVSPEANRQKGTLLVKVRVLRPDAYLTPQLSAKVDFLSIRPGSELLTTP